MTKFTMLIGLPASGKSTYTNQFKDREDTMVISSDEIREELFGSRSQEDNSRVFQEMFIRTKRALLGEVNVIYDATNINSKKRRALLSQLPKDIIKECVYFCTSIETCVINDRDREHKVGFDVIGGMYTSLQIPMKHEGWDKIEVFTEYKSNKIKTNEQICDLVKDKLTYQQFKDFFAIEFELDYEKLDFCQDSPHHNFSVFKHSYFVYECLYEFYNKEDKAQLLIAAILHDIGKLYCRKYDEEGRYATYYGHDSVSSQMAYEYLVSLGFNEEFTNKVCTIIQLHMRLPYDGDYKATCRLRDTIGEDLFDKLMDFRLADSSAK